MFRNSSGQFGLRSEMRLPMDSGKASQVSGLNFAPGPCDFSRKMFEGGSATPRDERRRGRTRCYPAPLPPRIELFGNYMLGLAL